MRRRSKHERRAKELLYVPLTEDDEKVRRSVRYRFGRWAGKQAIGLALAVVVGLPVAFVLDWIDDGRVDGLSTGQTVLVGVVWVASIFVAHSWWFFKRQDWSELRRGYRFRDLESTDDAEIVRAKLVLFDVGGSFEDREEAIQVLLGRGVCRPNTVSVAREALGATLAAVVVFAVFALLLSVDRVLG